MKKIDFLLAVCVIIVSLAHASDQPFLSTLEKPEARLKLGFFCDHVLRQVPSSDFFKFVDAHAQKYIKSDSELYESLLKKVNELMPRIQLIQKIAALTHQKKILGAQAAALLADRSSISGAVEIGSPGTYCAALNAHLPITGRITTVNDHQQISDRVAGFACKPRNGFLMYDQFVALNNYEPFSSAEIPDASVDLAICFIGLHHIPTEKLDNFIQSIHRILRPGGVFLLRDHDAYDQEMKDLVSAAHSTFNLIMNGDSVETEIAEYRNFQPLNFWLELLAKAGFTVDERRLTQENDPTLNTMIRCVRQPQTVDEQLQVLSEQIKKTDPAYSRDGSQTYLTTPEWLNVDISDAYASFIHHTPFYEFPYMQSVQCYWQRFFESWQHAAQTTGHIKIATSPYTLMNLFIGSFMTIEYAAKSLISLPIRTLFSGKEEATIRAIASGDVSDFIACGATVIKKDGSSDLLVIELPRYMKFRQALALLMHKPVTIHEIAGNKTIQVKLRTQINQHLSLPAGTQLLSSWTLPSDTEHSYATISCAVDQLLSAMRHWTSIDIEIIYVHDF